MQNRSLSPTIQQLILAFKAATSERKKIQDQQTIKVSETISSLAFVYEEVRNVVDYHEDHLFRINAIQRSLRRQFFLKKKAQRLGESLIRELIRSGYLQNQSVPTTKIKTVDQILIKYRKLFSQIGAKNSQENKKWILSVAASEIENALAPQEENDALVAANYQLLNHEINFPENLEKQKKLGLYIASQRSLIKPSLATLRYQLLLGFFPGWPKADDHQILKLAAKLTEIKKEINDQIASSLTEKLFYFCRQYAAPFLILKDVLLASRKNSQIIFLDPDKLSTMISEICQTRYDQIRSRLTRAAARSIIYIFLTKMLVGLFLEIPFELFVFGEIRTLPLVINSIFPPLLMFGFTLTVPKPGEKNTLTIIGKINEIAYQGTFKTNGFTLKPSQESQKSFRSFAFKIIYFLTFFLSFGLIIFGLTKLTFTLFSIMIFLFFLTVVSFFAYKINLTAKELIIEEKESPVMAVIDFFLIPILQIGRRLSLQMEKINIFNYALDFFIEAPLKSIFEIGEDWLSFMKEKKEKIL